MAERTRSDRLKDVRRLADKKSEYDLRYPYQALTDYTDYLLINVAKYVEPGGSVKRSIGNITDYYDKDGNQLNRRDVESGLTPPSKVDTNRTRIRERVEFDANILREGRLYNNYKKGLDAIILPIPSNIQDGNSISFGAGSLDGLTASVLDYTINTISDAKRANFNDLGKFIEQAGDRALDVMTRSGALEYFNRMIAASAANIPFGGNLTASQLLARQTGNILNPNMELLFEGVNLRSFKFSFKMTPRNPTEARAVKNIIRSFKKNMTPQITGSDGLYLKTPNIFELTYMKGSKPHPFLHKFKQCALTDMSVNYTGEGTYATYGGSDNQGGGTPVSLVMDLGFKELEPIYSSDYIDEGNDGYDETIHGGVGF